MSRLIYKADREHRHRNPHRDNQLPLKRKLCSFNEATVMVSQIHYLLDFNGKSKHLSKKAIGSFKFLERRYFL